MGTFLVTGSTGGIGGAVTRLLRERGHHLILAGRSAARLEERAGTLAAANRTQEIDRSGRSAGAGAAETGVVAGADTGVTPGAGASGGERAGATAESGVSVLTLDLAEPLRIETALAGQPLPRRLDGLVHCAGALELGTVADTSPGEWIDQLMVNLVGAAELTRVLLPALRAADGHVVFVNSGAGLRASPGWSAYAASKHGLRALADALRAEEPRLRVTTVYPGRTATEMQRKVRAQEGADYDAAAFTDPGTLASVVVNALETPSDGVITDVTVR